WKRLPENLHPVEETWMAPEFWIAAILTLGACLFLIARVRKFNGMIREPFAYIFLLFIACFVIGTQSEYAYILINILILLLESIPSERGTRPEILQNSISVF